MMAKVPMRQANEDPLREELEGVWLWMDKAISGVKDNCIGSQIKGFQVDSVVKPLCCSCRVHSVHQDPTWS